MWSAQLRSLHHSTFNFTARCKDKRIVAYLTFHAQRGGGSGRSRDSSGRSKGKGTQSTHTDTNRTASSNVSVAVILYVCVYVCVFWCVYYVCLKTFFTMFIFSARFLCSLIECKESILASCAMPQYHCLSLSPAYKLAVFRRLGSLC